MKAPIEPGRVIKSKKGRDKGHLFMVLYQVDADFLLIANGGARTLEKPKRKRVKHVETTPDWIAEERRHENRHIRVELAKIADAHNPVTDVKEGFPVVQD